MNTQQTLTTIKEHWTFIWKNYPFQPFWETVLKGLSTIVREFCPYICSKQKYIQTIMYATVLLGGATLIISLFSLKGALWFMLCSWLFVAAVWPAICILITLTMISYIWPLPAIFALLLFISMWFLKSAKAITNAIVPESEEKV